AAASVAPVTRSYHTRATSLGAGRTLRRMNPIWAQTCQSASTAAGNATYCAGKASDRPIIAPPAEAAPGPPAPIAAREGDERQTVRRVIRGGVIGLPN